MIIFHQAEPQPHQAQAFHATGQSAQSVQSHQLALIVPQVKLKAHQTSITNIQAHLFQFHPVVHQNQLLQLLLHHQFTALICLHIIVGIKLYQLHQVCPLEPLSTISLKKLRHQLHQTIHHCATTSIVHQDIVKSH